MFFVEPEVDCMYENHAVKAMDSVIEEDVTVRDIVLVVVRVKKSMGTCHEAVKRLRQF